MRDLIELVDLVSEEFSLLGLFHELNSIVKHCKATYVHHGLLQRRIQLLDDELLLSLGEVLQ